MCPPTGEVGNTFCLWRGLRADSWASLSTARPPPRPSSRLHPWQDNSPRLFPGMHRGADPEAQGASQEQRSPAQHSTPQRNSSCRAWGCLGTVILKGAGRVQH